VLIHTPVSGCIFDGVSPTTNAHIFRAGWIRDLMPDADVIRHVHTRHEPGREFDAEWRTERADFKVNCACDRCNAGWMNDLDHAAESIFVTAAAKGHEIKLASLDDKFTLARWCVLIAILFDQAQAGPRIAADFHRAFYRGEIPDGVAIWLAQVVPDDQAPAAFASIKDMVSEDEEGDPLLPPAFFLTFGIGRFVAQVMIPLAAAPERSGARRHLAEGTLKQLWPDLLTPLVWPPPNAVASAAMDDFARSFQTYEPLS
jgi:hypothetical protein